MHLKVGAQPVYRCGNLYSQMPCDGAQELNIKDKRSQAQKTQMDEATRNTSVAADRMEQSRLQKEKEQVRQQDEIRRAEHLRLAAIASGQRLADAKEKARLQKEKKALSKGLKLKKTRPQGPVPVKPQL